MLLEIPRKAQTQSEPEKMHADAPSESPIVSLVPFLQVKMPDMNTHTAREAHKHAHTRTIATLSGVPSDPRPAGAGLEISIRRDWRLVVRRISGRDAV